MHLLLELSMTSAVLAVAPAHTIVACVLLQHHASATQHRNDQYVQQSSVDCDLSGRV